MHREERQRAEPCFEYQLQWRVRSIGTGIAGSSAVALRQVAAESLGRGDQTVIRPRFPLNLRQKQKSDFFRICDMKKQAVRIDKRIDHA